MQLALPQQKADSYLLFAADDEKPISTTYIYIWDKIYPTLSQCLFPFPCLACHDFRHIYELQILISPKDLIDDQNLVSSALQ